MGQVLRVSILLVVMACAHRSQAIPAYRANIAATLAPRASPSIPAPATVEPKPWAIGQWSLYKMTMDGEVGYEQLGVVAVDACGIWVQLVTQSARSRTTITGCVHADPDGHKRVADVVWDHAGYVWTSDGRGRPEEVWLLEAFTPTWRGGDSPGEVVDVAAGHFEGAIREPVSSDGTIAWSHPAVPFGGRIRSASNGRVDRELVAFGDAGATPVISDLANRVERASQTPEPPHAFVNLGFGLTSPRGHGREDTNGGGMSVRIRSGSRVGRHFEVYGEAVFGQPENYKPDPTLDQATSLLLAGTRWTFLEMPRGELYLRGGLGVGLVERGPSLMDRTRDWGFGASLGLGLFTRVVEACGLTGELTDDLVIDGGGARHSLGVSMALQLQFPKSWLGHRED